MANISEMTLANKITLTRAGLSIIMFVGILIPHYYAILTASVIFLVAASTDWVDGQIARATGTCTPFGAIVDPFVDKILVCSALFAFTALPFLKVPVWAVFLIILRELTVSTLRVIAALDGSVMAAERWGKFKTTIQFITVGVIFAVLNIHQLEITARGKTKIYLGNVYEVIQDFPCAMTVIAMIITWISMFSYLSNNWSMLEKSWAVKEKTPQEKKPSGGKK